MCTIAHSSFRLFPAGTQVHYLSQTGNVVQARIEIPGGSTSGACVWSSDVNAVCTFRHGTGRLAHFRLRVVVTANADASVWYWSGTYRFTRHHGAATADPPTRRPQSGRGPAHGRAPRHAQQPDRGVHRRRSSLRTGRDAPHPSLHSCLAL